MVNLSTVAATCSLTFLLERTIPEDRVVDCHTSKIVVYRVVGVDEGVRDVGDVIPAIALTSQINLSVLDLESVDEALVEANEFLTKLDFIRDIGDTL